MGYWGNGTDTLLMAADHALRRELSHRIRDDSQPHASGSPDTRVEVPYSL